MSLKSADTTNWQRWVHNAPQKNSHGVGVGKPTTSKAAISNAVHDEFGDCAAASAAAAADDDDERTLGDFTFWLRLSLSLNFGLSTYLGQKVKWFRWAKTWRLTRIV